MRGMMTVTLDGGRRMALWLRRMGASKHRPKVGDRQEWLWALPKNTEHAQLEKPYPVPKLPKPKL